MLFGIVLTADEVFINEINISPNRRRRMQLRFLGTTYAANSGAIETAELNVLECIVAIKLRLELPAHRN